MAEGRDFVLSNTVSPDAWNSNWHNTELIKHRKGPWRTSHLQVRTSLTLLCRKKMFVLFFVHWKPMPVPFESTLLFSVTLLSCENFPVGHQLLAQVSPGETHTKHREMVSYSPRSNLLESPPPHPAMSGLCTYTRTCYWHVAKHTFFLVSYMVWRPNKALTIISRMRIMGICQPFL